MLLVTASLMEKYLALYMFMIYDEQTFYHILFIEICTVTT